MSGHSDLAACCLALEMSDAIVRPNRYPDEEFFPRVKASSEGELTLVGGALVPSARLRWSLFEYVFG